MKPIIIIIVAIIAILAVLWIFGQAPIAPEIPLDGTQDDTTSAVAEDIENLDLGDIDSEFEVIDQDLESL